MGAIEWILPPIDPVAGCPPTRHGDAGGEPSPSNPVSKLRKDCHKEAGREEAAQSQWVAKARVEGVFDALSGCAVDWGPVDMESAATAAEGQPQWCTAGGRMRLGGTSVVVCGIYIYTLYCTIELCRMRTVWARVQTLWG